VVGRRPIRKGLAEQTPLYGTPIKDNLADPPSRSTRPCRRFLAEFCFGDFHTRGGLTWGERGLLVLCALAIGDTAAQIGPHGRACIRVGNPKPPW
jgi:4-carboxymuconolactone decarboxylase